MGTNPKRTVTVQMVPQLAVVDTLSNKESNANFTKEPNLKLAQVCPKASLTSPDHKLDNSPLMAAPANVSSQSQKPLEPVSGSLPDNGNQKVSEHVTGGARQTQGLPHAGQGVGEAASGRTDSNANVKASSPGGEKHTCDSSLSSAVSASKVGVGGTRTSGAAAQEERAKPTSSPARGPAASEDGNKHVSPINTNVNACESKQAASEPQQESKGRSKSAAVPQTSEEPEPRTHSSSRSSVGLQEPPERHQQSIGATPPPACATPSRTSQDEQAQAKSACKNSASALPAAPASTATDDSRAVQDASARVQVGASQSDTAVTALKLYKEASTMTSSASCTPAKRCHDMEVQAVANMCSKAVATSPSLMPFAVTHRPSGAGGGGGGAVPRDDVMRLTVEAEMCPGQNAGTFFHPETLSPLQHAGLGAKPKEMGSALCSIQPVYQINIEHSSHKERGETGNSQDASGVQTSAAKTNTAEAQCVKSGAPPETESGFADGKNAALSQAAATTKPNQAPAAAAAANTASKSEPTKAKAESSKQAGRKAKTKETSSGKQKVEPDRNKDDERSEKQKGKSVHDVVWDEQGMTWEVYGASLDPESLGFAIQSHLQCKIKEQERKLMAQTSIRKSVSGVSSPQHGRKNKRRQQNIFRSMLQNVRRPNCCARPPPSSVLE